MVRRLYNGNPIQGPSPLRIWAVDVVTEGRRPYDGWGVDLVTEGRRPYDGWGVDLKTAGRQCVFRMPTAARFGAFRCVWFDCTVREERGGRDADCVCGKYVFKLAACLSFRNFLTRFQRAHDPEHSRRPHTNGTDFMHTVSSVALYKYNKKNEHAQGNRGGGHRSPVLLELSNWFPC